MAESNIWKPEEDGLKKTWNVQIYESSWISTTEEGSEHMAHQALCSLDSIMSWVGGEAPLSKG